MTYKTEIAQRDGEIIEIRYRVGHLPDEEVKKALDALVRVADSYGEKPPPRGYCQEVPAQIGKDGALCYWTDPEPLPRSVEIADEAWFRQQGHKFHGEYQGGGFKDLLNYAPIAYFIYDCRSRNLLVTAPTREKAIRALREKIEENEQ